MRVDKKNVLSRGFKTFPIVIVHEIQARGDNAFDQSLSFVFGKKFGRWQVRRARDALTEAADGERTFIFVVILSHDNDDLGRLHREFSSLFGARRQP